MYSFRFTGFFLSALIALISLSGCANKSHQLYQWGSYETEVYNHLTSGSSTETQIAALEKNMQKAQNTGHALPPGYHAHLGLLYGEVGRFGEMQQQFETEKMLYPESTQFMDFLLRKQNKNKDNK